MKRHHFTKIIFLGLSTILVLASSISANATTIKYTNWFTQSESEPNTITPEFTVNDDTDGYFEVYIGFGDSSMNTSVKGIFFDLGNNQITENHITEEEVGGSLSKHTDFATNTNKIKSVANMTPFAPFEVALGFKDRNLRAESYITFLVSDLSGTLSLADWGKVGIRFQGLSGDSSKYSSISSIPVPPAIILFGSSLLGLISITRRKSA